MGLTAMAKDKPGGLIPSFLPTPFTAVSIFRKKKKMSGWLLPQESLFGSYFPLTEMSFNLPIFEKCIVNE